MSFVRAIEGDTNSTVLDPEFHRQVQPPSRAEEMKRSGTPAPPVGSINRPQIASYPRPVSAAAASDLKGQNRLTVALDRLTANQAKIIARERGAAVSKEKQILSTAIAMIRRNRESQGMGQYSPQDLASMVAGGADLSPQEQAAWNALPLATKQQLLAPYAKYQVPLQAAPLPITMLQPLDPGPIAGKVVAGKSLTPQEAALWSGLSPVSRGYYVIQTGYQPQTAGAGPDTWSQILAWLESETIPGVKNGYLAAALGLFTFLSSAKKGRR